MTERVDFLAVMDGAVVMLDHENWRRDLQQARAAFAELIEHNRLMRDALGAIAGNTVDSAYAAMTMRQDARVALACVGGDK